jgi:signal transduction histidine kinase
MIIGIFLALFIVIIIYMFYNKMRLKNHELKEANVTKDKLFSIIAHDLRGPIGTALGISEFFIEEIKNKDLLTIKKYASMISQNLKDTFNLLNNLLEWSRSQLQKIEFNPQLLLLFNVFNEIKKLQSFQIEKKSIFLEINIEKNLQVYADEDMLKTILRNLISNAIKFSNENGGIIITANVKGKFIKVSVQDNGVGMDPEIIRSQFNLESNKSMPGTSGEKGTGLGLILVKEFVGKNGGEIWVKCEPGKGSIFSFTLLSYIQN